jgi:hypothetical protein
MWNLIEVGSQHHTRSQAISTALDTPRVAWPPERTPIVTCVFPMIWCCILSVSLPRRARATLYADHGPSRECGTSMSQAVIEKIKASERREVRTGILGVQRVGLCA